MFHYQRHHRYYAQANPGLVEIAAAELIALGARQARCTGGGVEFESDQEGLYRINYQARLVSRVLAPLAQFDCRGPEDLYHGARAIAWERIFSPGHTFAVFANVRSQTLRHSGFAALRVKDAVADRFRERFGRRPDVDPRNPDLWIALHLEADRATVYLDTSGGSLHRRGYRRQTVAAPIQETLAAAMVHWSGWKADRQLVDPMCGSGTLVCEALMAACRIPAGYLRRSFGFAFLPDYDNRRWATIKHRADGQIRAAAAGLIQAGDVAPQAVSAARGNLARLPHGEKVRVRRCAFQDWKSLENALILCNPPYGIRLEQGGDLAGWYARLGDFLKQRCRGATALVYFGRREYLKHIGLRPAWKKPIPSGGLDGRLARFDMY
ncbi:MAG: class I SAM-dependent RNA methyltransferase [Deltaproteobacteria bacterium]|nr:MAG: class I SAM-dependent RNA methyltransferase [Deltaproteobacteria bacterium]